MEKNVSFTQFENKISSQMQLPLGTFVLKYKDDEGDVIPIASDIELEEAVRQAATRSPPVIEVIVETRKVVEGEGEQELRDAKKQRNEAKSEDEHLVIHPAVCSVCQFPIVGTRYKCIVCPHFDLCELCEAADNSHPVDHPFIKAKRPLPADVNSIVALSSGLRTVSSSVENGAKQVVGGVQTGFQQLTSNLHSYQQHLKQSVVEHQPQIDAARQQAMEKWRQFNQEMRLQAQALSENLRAKASELGEKLKREKEQWFAASNQSSDPTTPPPPPPQETTDGTIPASIPSAHPSAPATPTVSTSSTGLFSDQLATLASMGFNDTDKNLSLLSRNKGDVSLTIQTLLDGV